MSIREVHGDLFSAPASCSMVQCISRDLAMGKGIVVKFTQRFGNMRPELQSMNLSVGDVGAIARPPSRWVFNIVNKEKHWSKATYQDLQRGLQSLAAHCMDKGVTNLAMPAIGCGLDGLEWSKVKPLVQSAFDGTGVSITVYFYP